MLRSMFAGISGLRSHQTMMDVVGNNISNVNTPGYKASTVTFEEALTQTLRAPQAAGDDRGGANPLQIGLGTRVAAIDAVFTQGANQVTGRNTDLAIQGQGFFMVQEGGATYYTRAGGFSFDEAGNLVAPDGARVLGWMADATGAIDTDNATQPITLPVSQVIDPRATAEVQVGGNLPADAAVGDTVVTASTVYDSLGRAVELTITFEKTGANSWDATVEADDGDPSTSWDGPATVTPASLTFDATGALTSGATLAVSGLTPPDADPLDLDIILDGPTPIVQFGGTPSVEAYSQDGSAIGQLRGFSIANDGTVIGEFSNGSTKVLARLAVATFNNPAGLTRVGESKFLDSVNSGPALIGTPGTGNRGTLTAGTLEMSNVDLAQEFTNMIIAQRGFQANSRIITASDEILNDLVNMKR